MGGHFLGSYKTFKSASAAYNLIEAALRIAKVDLTGLDFCLVLEKE
nr:MAG TPA: hypothetical protein [Microviridae sp.]